MASTAYQSPPAGRALRIQAENLMFYGRGAGYAELYRPPAVPVDRERLRDRAEALLCAAEMLSWLRRKTDLQDAEIARIFAPGIAVRGDGDVALIETLAKAWLRLGPRLAQQPSGREGEVMSTQTNGNGRSPEFPVARETIAGDIRDAFIAMVKRLPKPWAKMSEGEQRAAISQATTDAHNITAKAVEHIAAEDRPHIVCRVEKVTLDDKGEKLAIAGIPAQDDAAIDATRLQGRRVVLTLASPHAHMDERAPLRPEPDQRALVHEEAHA